MRMRLRPRPRPAKAATSSRAWGRDDMGPQTGSGSIPAPLEGGTQGPSGGGRHPWPDWGPSPPWDIRFVGRDGVPSPPGWRLGLCDLELGQWEAQVLGSSSTWPTHGCVAFGRAPPLSEPQVSPRPGSWMEHLSGLKPRSVGSGGGWGLLFLEMCVRLGVVGLFPPPGWPAPLPTRCSLSVPCC